MINKKRIFFIISIISMLMLVLSACIKRFDPEIRSSDIASFVVTGQVSKGDEIQQINIAMSSPVSDFGDKSIPTFIPVNGCQGYIIDNNGNSYPLSNTSSGGYQCYIPDRNMVIGSSYKLQILTPGGDSIVSEFDHIPECPDIDSIYYNVEQLPVVDPYHVVKGIRFYCNLDATHTSSRNFRFEATETWEYRAVFATFSSGAKICFKTDDIKNIFTLSTKNFSENKYKHFPLHFVDNYSSQRLRYGYSLQLRQYSLSAAAYVYWEKVRTNYSDQGGLYTKLPTKIKGNLHNLTHPEEPVLGFFGASEVKSKRIFIDKINGLDIEYLDCDPPVALGPKPEPSCYNCMLEGGTNVKPSFWPR